MNISLIIYSLTCDFRLFEVAHHDVPAAHADLSAVHLHVLGHVCIDGSKLGVEPIQSLAEGAQLLARVGIGQLGSRAFAHPVDLQDPDVQAHEVLQHLYGERRSSRVASETFAQSKLRLHLGEHHLVGNLVLE